MLSPAARAPSIEAQIADVQRLFATQRAQHWAVAQSSAEQRQRRLLRFKAAINAHRSAFYRAFQQDYGKPQAEVELFELLPVIAEIDHAVAELARWMRSRSVATPLMLIGTYSEIRPEPKGVVLILGPFNYPVLLLFSPIVAAVAAGNCVIARPSEKVPNIARVMGQVITAAFPANEVALVAGEVEVADALLKLPLDHFFFTGSGTVGRKVMHAAAEQLASVTLELGGKSPAVVDQSADLATVVERLMWGKLINTGQTCVAPDYALVHESQLPLFLAEANAAITKFYGPTPAMQLQSADLTQLIDERAFTRLTKLLAAAIAAGATVAAGGSADPVQRKIAPTLLTNVTPENPIMAEEIFGPILPVLTYQHIDQALDVINANDTPLSLYIFSRDEATIQRILRGTRAGGTVVNDTVIHLGNPNLPFGGSGPSGLGSYHGEYGFRAFSHERAILRQGHVGALALLYPPYTARTHGMLHTVRTMLYGVLPALRRVFR